MAFHPQLLMPGGSLRDVGTFSVQALLRFVDAAVPEPHSLERCGLPGRDMLSANDFK